MNQFGIILKNARESKGLSQKELSAIIEIERNTYSTYETGKREPSLEVLGKIMRHLNIGAEILYLLTGQNVPREISSSILAPAPDADLLQLMTALRELQIAAAEIQHRIDKLLPLKKDSSGGETLSSQIRKGSSPKADKSDKDQRGT